MRQRRRVRLGATRDTQERFADGLPATPATTSWRLDEILTAGTLRCGVVNHPPLSAWKQTANSTEFIGYYPELARQVGRNTDLDIEFVKMDWGLLADSFTEQDLDLVLSIFETRARQEFADFAAALHKVGVSGVMKDDRPPMLDVSELSAPDVKISVVIGEVGWEYITQELCLPRWQVTQIDSCTLETAFSALMAGGADVAIVDDLTCAEFVATHPGYRHVFTDDPLYLCKNAIMVPKGEPEFRRWVDNVFLEARTTPALRALEVRTLAAAGGWVKKFR